MKKLIIAGIILAVIVAGAVLVVVNLEGIVNRNKDTLLARAEKQLGRKITIGEIGVTVWGGLGVRIDDFTVSDDPSFSDEPFVRAKSLQVDVEIMPLFRKELRVKRVTLNDPVIRIIRDGSGMLNTVQPKEPSAGETDTPAAAVHATPFAISLVNISGGDLTYIDRSTGSELRVRRIESKVEGLEFTQPVSMELRAAMFGDDPNVSVTGTFGPVGEVFDPATLKVNATLEADPIVFEAVAAVFPAALASFPPDVSISGPLAVKAKLAGTLARLDVEAEIDGTKLVLARTGKFNKPAGTPLTVTAQATYSPTLLTIASADFRLHELRANVSGEYRMEKPALVHLTIHSEPIPLTGWDALLPETAPLGLAGTARFDGAIVGALQPGQLPKITGTALLEDAGASPPQAYKPITGARGKLELLGDGARLDDMSLTIGSTTFTTTAQVKSFVPLRATYNATSPAIGLDDFRPAGPRVKKPEVIRKATVEGTIDAEKHVGSITSTGGSVANIDYKNLRGNYAVAGKEVTLSDVRLETLDGAIEGRGKVTLDEASPSFEVNAQVRSVNAIDLVEMIPGSVRKLVSGKVNLDVSASGTGKQWDSIQKSVNGNGLAQLFDGALLDFNVFRQVLDELGQRTGRTDWISQNIMDKYPRAFKDRDTKFDNLKSDFVVEAGRLKARNLQLTAGNYVMAGVGSVGFDKTLEMKITMTLSPAFSADLISDVREAKYLANSKGVIEVPFTLTGTLPNVKPGLDPNYVGELIKKALLQESGKKLLDGILGGKKGGGGSEPDSKN